jgi:hypothetical protein
MIIGTPTASAFPRAETGTGAVSSTVPLGDGSWSLLLMTGELERGDGRAIAAPLGKGPVHGRIERVLPPGSPDVTRWGVKPDHLVGKGPARADYSWPRVRSAFEHEESEAKPAKDEFITKAVSLLRDSLKKS